MPSFYLLLWKHLLIFIILPVTLFKELVEAFRNPPVPVNLATEPGCDSKNCSVNRLWHVYVFRATFPCPIQGDHVEKTYKWQRNVFFYQSSLSSMSNQDFKVKSIFVENLMKKALIRTGCRVPLYWEKRKLCFCSSKSRLVETLVGWNALKLSPMVDTSRNALFVLSFGHFSSKVKNTLEFLIPYPGHEMKKHITLLTHEDVESIVIAFALLH